MPQQARTPQQRLKILYLYKILTECTDENHAITMPEIISKLEAYNISAARKALYDDIEALKLYGLDIVDTKGRKADYRVVSREFEIPELKLLADAVSSSKFLTEKKSMQLLEKLSTLCSTHQAKYLKRPVYVSGKAKAMNDRIYINVDVVHRAIRERKQISFDYFSYDINKHRVYRDERRVCTPYHFVWDDEKYYVVGYYEKRNSITNFRIDRMENVEIEDDPAVAPPENFNLTEYLSSSFSMFSGETTDVKLCIDNSLVNVVIDRFGKDTKMVPYDDDHFTINVKVKAEATFFGWLFQFGGKIRILSPNSVIIKYKDMLTAASDDIE